MATNIAEREGVIRCDVCSAPANTLTANGSWCLVHASERHLLEGGWSQFELRDRILMSPAEARARRRDHRSDS